MTALAVRYNIKVRRNRVPGRPYYAWVSGDGPGAGIYATGDTPEDARARCIERIERFARTRYLCDALDMSDRLCRACPHSQPHRSIECLRLLTRDGRHECHKSPPVDVQCQEVPNEPD